MKKLIIIKILFLFIFLFSLTGCFDVFPESEEEFKQLEEGIERIENRVYVTIYSTVEFFKNESPVANITVNMDLISTSGQRGSWFKDTNSDGYVDFAPVTYYIDKGGEISATALIMEYGISRSKWLNYDSAKEKATFDNDSGYKYTWYVSIPLEYNEYYLPP